MTGDDSIPFHLSDEEHAAAAAEQRAMIRRWADQIERGQAPASLMHRQIAAAILRHHADGIPDEPKRTVGQRPQVAAGEIAIQFVLLRRDGLSKNRAHEILAERHGCSVPTIKRAVEKHGGAAERLVSGDW